MPVINIKIRFDEKETRASLGSVGERRGLVRKVRSLISESKELVEPRAVYTFLEIKRKEDDRIFLEDEHELRGRVLKVLLKTGQKIAPFVVTIGHRIEEKASSLKKEDMFSYMMLDKLGNYAVRKARKKLQLLVEKELTGKVSKFSPGEGTGELFDIEQQKAIFEILKPRKIGVELTPSYLMTPLKSSSGLFATVNQDYIACQHCPRKHCEYRQASFKGESLI